MKRWCMHASFLVAVILCFFQTPVLAAGVNDQASQNSAYTIERSSRGSFSGPTGGSGPYRSGPQRPSPGITPAPGTPGAPGAGGGFGAGFAPRTGFGGFFGGLAAGAIGTSIFHAMFNPFGGYGYGGFGGPSLLGIVLDVIIIFVVYRIVRRFLFRDRFR